MWCCMTLLSILPILAMSSLLWICVGAHDTALWHVQSNRTGSKLSCFYLKPTFHRIVGLTAARTEGKCRSTSGTSWPVRLVTPWLFPELRYLGFGRAGHRGPISASFVLRNLGAPGPQRPGALPSRAQQLQARLRSAGRRYLQLSRVTGQVCVAKSRTKADSEAVCWK